MIRRTPPATILLLLTICAALALPAVAQTAASSPARTSAEIRINLPENSDGVVAIVPGTQRITLDLPRGSVYPADFEAASGGLLRGGEAEKQEDVDRITLQLELAQGLLDRIVYDPEGIVLRLTSRFELGRGDSGEGYVLGPQDRIIVTVHNHPELQSQLTIAEEGTITAPLVGELPAAGLTARQLSSKVAELLGRNYLVDPQVEVEVDKYRSQWVMVGGEVRLAGRVPLRGGTRLKEVLSEAQGFTETAGEQITISRRLEGSEEFGTMHIDRATFERGESNPRVAHGDIIEVTRSSYCYVQGEVKDPHRVRIEREMTLLKAITLVGGLTDWADKRTVKVLAGEGPDQRVQIYNLNKIWNGRSEDPVLTGGEIIIVQRRFF